MSYVSVFSRYCEGRRLRLYFVGQIQNQNSIIVCETSNPISSRAELQSLEKIRLEIIRAESLEMESEMSICGDTPINSVNFYAAMHTCFQINTTSRRDPCTLIGFKNGEAVRHASVFEFLNSDLIMILWKNVFKNK